MKNILKSFSFIKRTPNKKAHPQADFLQNTCHQSIIILYFIQYSQ